MSPFSPTSSRRGSRSFFTEAGATLRKFAAVLVVTALAAPSLPSLAGKLEIKRADFGSYEALWRISHDPAAEDHNNYHQHQCWSYDGRYLSYRHSPTVANPQSGVPYGGYQRPVVHVYDFLKDEDRPLGLGITMLPGASRANHRNWLFYVQLKSEDRGFPPEGGAPVIWVDLENGTETKIGDGMDQLGGVSHNDEWLYGGIKDPTRKPAFRTARLRIASTGGVEELKDLPGFQWVVNPRFPLFFTRHDNPGKPFAATVSWWDLDGANQRTGMLVLEAAHMAWQGNGEHFLIGDGLPRGRRWNEPVPGNVHVLAAGTVGNLSACGHSGRFVVGDSALFDLRSGDSWQYRYFFPGPLKPTTEFYPNFDGQAKGSPDGTKVAFTVRYDMEKGPVTELTETLQRRDEVLHVKSTEGFPDSGTLVVWTELMAYESKTATRFEGLARGTHGTRVNVAPAGRGVTDFTHHLLAEDEWKKVTAVGNEIRLDIPDANSPLLRQRGRDVYVAAVRRPDRPSLKLAGDGVQLVPGESHYETAGYHVHHNGRRITPHPIRAGEVFPLPSPGEYAAVAVEWSGLESENGNVVKLTAAASLEVLTEIPADFVWTQDRWLMDGREVAPDIAAKAGDAVREVLHRYDGLIAREHYRSGEITEHHDLNHEGKAIRRLTYEGGKLALRDYYNRDDQHASRQIFAPDGLVTETIRFEHNHGVAVERDHWWFEGGTPVRRVAGGSQLVKEGEEWVSTPYRPQ